MPRLKTSLIDERDTYLAQKIREAPGQKIVAVVGAGHIEGMSRAMAADQDVDLEDIESIAPASPIWKWVGWAIPLLIVSSIAWIGATQGFNRAGENALYWFLANAIPSGIGGLLAFAHPLTTLAAFFAAPFTSLTPVIGAGYVAAFVQTWFVPPTVHEIQTVGEAISTAKGWWTNRLLRILLVFLLTTLGSVIGTWVGGFEIISNLFG